MVSFCEVNQRPSGYIVEHIPFLRSYFVGQTSDLSPHLAMTRKSASQELAQRLLASLEASRWTPLSRSWHQPHSYVSLPKSGGIFQLLTSQKVGASMSCAALDLPGAKPSLDLILRCLPHPCACPQFLSSFLVFHSNFLPTLNLEH